MTAGISSSATADVSMCAENTIGMRSVKTNISYGNGISPLPDPRATMLTAMMRSVTMAAAAIRMACPRGWLAGVGKDVSVVAIMAVVMFAAGHGGSAAAEPAVGEKPAVVAPAVGAADEAPIALAGRWTGPRYGYARIGPNGHDGGKASTLTYDIVACGEGWCGIAVSDEEPCGAVGLRIAPDKTKNSPNAFNGKLELAKGTALYVVEAWYAAPDAGDQGGRSAPRLSLIGDTGTELLMMRRSFPLQAELTRISDAQCTLEKATS